MASKSRHRPLHIRNAEPVAAALRQGVLGQFILRHTPKALQPDLQALLPSTNTVTPSLTSAQLEIALLVAQGLSHKRIAELRSSADTPVTEAGVASAVGKARDAAGARTAPHLVRRLADLGRIPNPPPGREPPASIAASDMVVLGLVSYGVQQSELRNEILHIDDIPLWDALRRTRSAFGEANEKRMSTTLTTTLAFAYRYLAPELQDARQILPPRGTPLPWDFVIAGMKHIVGPQAPLIH